MRCVNVLLNSHQDITAALGAVLCTSLSAIEPCTHAGYGPARLAWCTCNCCRATFQSSDAGPCARLGQHAVAVMSLCACMQGLASNNEYEEKKLKMRKAMGESLHDGVAGEAESSKDRRLNMIR